MTQCPNRDKYIAISPFPFQQTPSNRLCRATGVAPCKGVGESGTKSATPGGVPYLAAQIVPAGLLIGRPTELPYSVHDPS